MFVEKPECLSTDPKSLLQSVKYLSDVLSAVQYYRISDPETCNKFLSNFEIVTEQVSLIVQQEEIDSTKNDLEDIASALQGTFMQVEEGAINKLQNMTASMNFDSYIAKFVESQVNNITADQVAEGCEKFELLKV